jgi:hypothetical protein
MHNIKDYIMECFLLDVSIRLSYPLTQEYYKWSILSICSCMCIIVTGV